MNCENFYCIYQSNGECTAENISINRIGMCMDCIYPNIDTTVLEKAKRSLLKKYEESDNKHAL